MKHYLLTHEYMDGSSFNVCGLTENTLVAEVWFKSNSDNNVYEFAYLDEIKAPNTGLVGWRNKK